MLARFMSCRDDANELECERNMLVSAKQTLNFMPFFGLSDRCLESEKLFEWTFNLKFRTLQETGETRAESIINLLPLRSRKLIEAAEYLDMELWHHANGIFEERIKACGLYCSIDRVKAHVEK